MTKSKHRITSLFLAVCMIISCMVGMSVTAQAADDPDPVGASFVKDGITYYNVYSTNFDSNKRFYEDLIDTKSALLDFDSSSGASEYSIADLWFLTLLGIEGNRDYFDDHFQDVMSNAKTAILDGKTSGSYMDTHDYYNWNYNIEPAKWVNSGNSGYVEKVMRFPPRSTLNVNSMKYAIFTLRFSDFVVVPILPDNTGKNYVTTSTEDTAVGDPDYVYEMTNTSLDVGKLTQKESTSYANTVTNSVNHSFQYSFKEGIEFGIESSATGIFAGIKVSSTVSAEFQQAITDGWTKGESKTCNSGVEGSGDIPVPPHTIVRLERRKTQSDTVTKYNCPVALKYKVELFVTYQAQSVAVQQRQNTFDYDAAAKLKKRAIDDGGDHYDTENINWDKVLSDKNVSAAIKTITTHVPMSGVGATITQHLETTNIKAVTTPLYPLGRTVMTAPDASFVVNSGLSDLNYLKAEMKVGDSYSTALLKVKGYDTKGAEYYGFSQNAGSWAVVKTDNSEFAEGESPIKLTKDAVSGVTQFTAVRPGKCRLVYVIDENKYVKTSSPYTTTKNSDLSGRATMEITVTGEKANFEITGSFHGYVSLGNDIVKANLEDSLEVAAYDNTDMEVDVDYYWQARETARKGIKVSPDGTVVFSKPGKFHVRVVNKDDPTNYSPWYEITAEQLGDDDPELVLDQEYDIPDDSSVWSVTGSFTGQTGIEPVSLEREGGLVPAVYDTTGRELNVNYKWEKQESSGMTLTDSGIVTFTKPGTYHVRIAYGNYHSDWKAITVTGADTTPTYPPNYVPTYFTPVVTTTTEDTDTKTETTKETTPDISKYNITGKLDDAITSELKWDTVPNAESYSLYVKTDGKYVLLQKLGTATNADVVLSASGKYYVSAGGNYTVYKYDEKAGKFTKTGTLAASKIESIAKANNVTEDFMVKYTVNGKESAEKDSYKVSVKVYYKPAVKLTANKGSITVKWNKVSGAEKYKVFKVVNGKLRLVTETEKHNIRITGTKAGKEYSYAVKAYVDGKWTKVYSSDLATVTAK